MNLASVINKNFANKQFLVEVCDNAPHKTYTYRDLDEKSSWFARGLIKAGVKQQQCIAILSENSFNYIVAYYGALKAGVIAVLVNDKMTDEQIEYVLSDSKSQLLFTTSHKKFNVNTVNLSDIDSFYDAGDFDMVQDPDLAVYLYTSGSTGVPKGVAYSHKNHYWIIDMHVNAGGDPFKKDKVLVMTPLYHLNALANIEIQLKRGNLVVLLNKFNTKLALDAIDQYKINLIPTITTAMALLVNDSSIENRDLSSVRLIRIGSSITTESIINKIKSYFKNSRVIVTYGTTETGPGMFGSHPKKIAIPTTSVGYPLSGVEYKLVDSVLHIKVPSIMKGYNNKQELFNEVVSDDGWYNTKDIFTVDKNGFYYCLGRADEMFKSGGNIVYPFEIETLLEEVAGVKHSAVIAVEDEIKSFIPVAFVVASDVDEQQLKEYILSKTAAYKHPRKIIFLDEMPTTGSGKIDKVVLKQYYKDRYVI